MSEAACCSLTFDEPFLQTMNFRSELADNNDNNNDNNDNPRAIVLCHSSENLSSVFGILGICLRLLTLKLSRVSLFPIGVPFST